MATYPNVNAANQYARDIVGGKILACQLSTNDIRRMENLPPIAGGDKYLTPLNMVDSAKILPGDKSPTAKQLAEIETLLARA
ncbi:hypothetical protein [Klebsiella pneumoniae]|uniref:hypothetical protein n=1 Tax=Klebsiella pneumoniae TaxID=573 RepID=UPI00211E57B9